MDTLANMIEYPSIFMKLTKTELMTSNLEASIRDAFRVHKTTCLDMKRMNEEMYDRHAVCMYKSVVGFLYNILTLYDDILDDEYPVSEFSSKYKISDICEFDVIIHVVNQ